MKAKSYILPLLSLALLASCGGGNNSSATGFTSRATGLSSSEPSSTKPAPTFRSFPLSELHTYRVNKILRNLTDTMVSIKGKVTSAKHVGDDDGTLTIQDGKYAVEVTYPTTYSVNVGDVVEVKGAFRTQMVGEVDTIWVSTHKSDMSSYDIQVINEAISVEKVTITKEADLLEYDSSVASIAFDVTGNRTNAAFIGKLAEGETEFIVANKLSIAEKFPEAPYAVGDKVQYDGIFTYAGDSSAKVIRYFDREGFTKKN